MSSCPDPETLAEMAEGRLPASTRSHLVGHLARCPDCHEVLAESARFVEQRRLRKRVLGLSRPRLAAALTGLAAAAAVVFAVIRVPDRERQALPAQKSSAPLPSVPDPLWLTDAPWEGRSRLAFADVRSPSTSVWIGLHVGALDRACTLTEADLARTIRQRVAASLKGNWPGDLPLAVLEPEACAGRRVNVPGSAAVDGGWLTLGRVLERWRIAAAERDSGAITDDDRTAVTRLIRELPVSDPARRSLQRTLHCVSMAPRTPHDWDELGEAVIDSIEVLVI
jgi:hypothetical protein